MMKCLSDIASRLTAAENLKMPAKRKGLYANINARRKKGISRSKKKSTISPQAWAAMKSGFKKSKKRGSKKTKKR